MKLYVSYIPWKVTEAELEELFRKYGEVLSVKICYNKFGQSLGYGFVEMGTREEGLRCIDHLNGLKYRNCRLNVAPARKK